MGPNRTSEHMSLAGNGGRQGAVPAHTADTDSISPLMLRHVDTFLRWLVHKVEISTLRSMCAPQTLCLRFSHVSKKDSDFELYSLGFEFLVWCSQEGPMVDEVLRHHLFYSKQQHAVAL
eukprot:gene5269-biopygen13065